jgi:hypothetical protein
VMTCTAHSDRMRREVNANCPRSPNFIGRLELPCRAPLFIWITSSECRRTKEFIHPRVDLILN